MNENEDISSKWKWKNINYTYRFNSDCLSFYFLVFLDFTFVSIFRNMQSTRTHFTSNWSMMNENVYTWMTCSFHYVFISSKPLIENEYMFYTESKIIYNSNEMCVIANIKVTLFIIQILWFLLHTRINWIFWID